MSNKQIIQESVHFGSVALSLQTQIFDPISLMNYLVKEPLSIRTKVAYKLLCDQLHPHKHYLADGSHFLIHQPNYLMIAMYYNLDLTVPTQINEPDSLLIDQLCEPLIEAQQDKDLQEETNLIAAGSGTVSYVVKHSTTYFLARNFAYIKQFTAHDMNLRLVDADWPEKFRYNEQLPKLIVKRIKYLQQHAPLYYSTVAQKIYHAVISKLYKDNFFSRVSKKQLSTINKNFPNIIDPVILTYDDLCYKVSLLGNEIAGYVLGFPIQNMIPTKEQIREALQILIKMGVHKYVEQIRNYVKLTYTPIIPIPCQNISYPNETDVITEEIDNYVPFDIISYQVGTHMYRFTRAEFPELVKSKKNPWTNDWFPATILATIVARNNAAKELGLPPARPLTEMLDRIEKDKFFEVDPVSQNSNRSNSLTLPFPFNLLISRQFTDEVEETEEEEEEEDLPELIDDEDSIMSEVD
jgi:hypothetical protein